MLLNGIFVQNCSIHDLTNHISGGNPTGITFYACDAAVCTNNKVINIGSTLNRGTGIEWWTSINSLTQLCTIISPNTQMTAGIYHKNASQGNNTIRHNYIDMTLAGSTGAQGCAMDNDQGGKDVTYGNIIICDNPVGPAVIGNGYWNAIQIFENNTFVGIPNSSVGMVTRFASATGNIHFFNNIVQRGTIGGRGDLDTVIAQIGLIDYNCMPATPVYGSTTDGAGGYPSTTYTSQTTFAAALPSTTIGKEAHTVYNNTPGFTGTGTLAAKYQLASGSPCINAGMSGGQSNSYPVNLGAWDGWSLQIGCNF